MTETEFGKLVVAIKTYYPREKLFPNRQSVELWYRELSDLDYLTAETAIRKHVSTSVYPPTIAEIREAALDVMQGGAADDWSTGWAKVQKAIRQYGSYRQEEALNSFDEVTRACVESLGWMNLCLSENPTADRANFRNIYGTIAERKRATARLPESVRAVIEMTAKKLVEKTEVGYEQ